MEGVERFREAIIAEGFPDPRSVVADGAIHRFGIKKVCWYVGYTEGDFLAGAFGDWREHPTKHTWNNKGGNTSGPDWAFMRERMREAEAQRKRKTKTAQAKAKRLWDTAGPVDPAHPYLINKGITEPKGIRQKSRALIVPVKDVKTGEILSLQFINEDGEKRFLINGKIQGGSFQLEGDQDIPLMVCEGYATGLSIHKATGASVIVTFNAGNLKPVADSIREKSPGREVVVCADNDQFTNKPDGTPWNPGREKALSVAWTHNWRVAIPQFSNIEGKPSDFNDLHLKSGIDAVRQQIQEGALPQEILLRDCGNDVGACYRPEHIEGLRLFEQRDKASYVALKAKLKKLKVGITELERDVKNTGKPEGDKGLNHLAIAKQVREQLGHENIIDNGVFIWKWNHKGLWRKVDDREIRQMIHEKVEKVKVSKTMVDSILDLFKTEVFRPNHEFDVNTTAINCLNGELHWTGERWELKEHRRENFRTTQIPVEYDQVALAPRFKQFLAEVFEGDADAEPKATLLCELIGYSLLSSTNFERFVLLLGAGANGKSAFLETLASLVGSESVSAVQPSQFSNRFQRAHLHNKLVNIVTEMQEGHVIQDTELKSIVSGELTTAEHKHKPPFEFRPYATCWFAANHMPHTRDFSNATFRRAVILPFNRAFSEDEQDKQLKAKLTAELPGILNLALETLAGVLKKEEFTKTESCEMAKKEWRLNCDQVQQFVEECCVFEPGAKIESSILFRQYRGWAEDAGIMKTLNRNNFTSRMCGLGAVRVRGGGGARMLAGIKYRYKDF